MARLVWREHLRKIPNTIQKGKPTSFSSFVWCLSTGRVGSQTLAALGAKLPGVTSTHEPLPLLYGLGCENYESGNEQNQVAFAEAVRACRPYEFKKESGIYLETSPQVTFLAPLLDDVFPNSRFIHIVRDPESVVKSGLDRRWYLGNANDKWRIVPAELSKWDGMSAFEKNLQLWHETNKWICGFLDTVDSDQVLRVKSEELFSGDKLVCEQIGNFIMGQDGFSIKSNRILAKKLNKQRNPGREHGYVFTEKELERIKDVCGPMLDRYGYN